ncbi:MAG TPA: hypothetical protein ENK60_06720 [Anaerolineae bacterium]|nr:hypothetical protein [Anaerolineae bacterium]
MSPSAVITRKEQQQIIARIDAIIQELEALRRELTFPEQPEMAETTGIVESLFGAAGQGSRNEYDDILGIWGRFE